TTTTTTTTTTISHDFTYTAFFFIDTHTRTQFRLTAQLVVVIITTAAITRFCSVDQTECPAAVTNSEFKYSSVSCIYKLVVELV
ncbi:MAG: hypothetical protein EZS28_044767, partial [Streblomastix strix]